VAAASAALGRALKHRLEAAAKAEEERERLAAQQAAARSGAHGRPPPPELGPPSFRAGSEGLAAVLDASALVLELCEECHRQAAAAGHRAQRMVDALEDGAELRRGGAGAVASLRSARREGR